MESLRRFLFHGRRTHRAAQVGTGVALLTLLLSPGSALAGDPMCVRDGTTGRRALMFTDDGRYAFCGCAGTTVTGSAVVTQEGNQIIVEHDGPDYLRATIDTETNSGTATLNTPVRVGACDIEDSAVTNGICACDFSCILSCPEDMRVRRAPGAKGATVAYREPTRSDTAACGEVTCSIGSGTIFRPGTAIVRCATEQHAACSFSVTVD